MRTNFLLIALRYVQTKHKDAAIATMIRICFAGIGIATCALALVVCVMQGFERATHERMQSIYPDLIIDTQGQAIDFEKIKPILQEPVYGIAHVSPQRIEQAMLYNCAYANPTVICLRAIDPEAEQHVTTLATKTITPAKTPMLAQLIFKNYIFIGYKLAQQLNVALHDTISILYSNDEPKNLSITFKQAPVHIGGIFKTGIDEFDTNLVFCAPSFFDQLFPERGITQLYLKLQDKNKVQPCLALQERLHVAIYPWQSLYPSLVGALKLEKYAMFFILLLIVVIASMNMLSLIFMFTTQKKREIALLLAFGMPLAHIKLLFISISLYICFFATSTGLLLAYGIGYIIQRYPIITLPDDAYITTTLPIDLDPTIFCIIFFAALGLSCLASLIAIKKIPMKNIAHTLRYE